MGLSDILGPELLHKSGVSIVDFFFLRPSKLPSTVKGYNAAVKTEI